MIYNNLHTKIRKEWGKPNKCELCKGKRGKHFEWSNKDHKYTLLKKDWWMLCSFCHREYDAKKFPREAWNKGIKGLKPWHNISGLNATAWNKGLRKRKNLICICGKEFYPPKPSSRFCSKHCAMIGNKRAN